MFDSVYFIKNRTKTIKQVAIEEAEKGGVSLEAIIGDSRDLRTTRARWMAMYRAKKELGASYSAIGRILNKDHSTVLHAVQRMDAVNENSQVDEIIIPCYGFKAERKLGKK